MKVGQDGRNSPASAPKVQTVPPDPGLNDAVEEGREAHPKSLGHAHFREASMWWGG